MLHRREFVQTITATAMLSAPLLAANAAVEPSRVLILVGPTDHPPGTHEVAAGARLMKYCLENISNLPGIKADIVDKWPIDDAVLNAAATVVLIGDTFPLQRLPDTAATLSKLGAMMDRGCGIVCVHYATGLRAEDVAADGDHPLLRWMGGYFATKCKHHQSVARVFNQATVTPAAADHPVNRGWQEYTLRDEPYINNYFGKDGNKLAANVTAIATSMLPPEAPKREVIGWCVDREDGGRGFALVMPHFYKNWSQDDLRCCILNGIVWTAKREVPAAGVQTKLPELSEFKPAAVEPRSKKPSDKAAAALPAPAK